MSELKISNGLLSAVLGCECEFMKTTESNEVMFRFPMKSKDIIQKLATNKTIIVTCEWACYINLDTFVSTALDYYICNTGYGIDLGLRELEVLKTYVSTGDDEVRRPYRDNFCSPPTRENRIAVILKALEWIQNEISNGN